MNITTLRQRLEKLEAQSVSHAAPQPLHPLTKLLNVLVAYHLGGAGPSDSIAGALARGLGYDGSGDFRTTLQANADTVAAEDMDTRWRDAMRRLFALKGATPDCDGPTFGDTLVDLFADLPEWLRHHRSSRRLTESPRPSTTLCSEAQDQGHERCNELLNPSEREGIKLLETGTSATLEPLYQQFLDPLSKHRFARRCATAFSQLTLI